MEFPEHLRKVFAEYGRQGGKKRARRLSKTARQESAKRAAAARWKDHVPKTKAKTKAKVVRQRTRRERGECG